MHSNISQSSTAGQELLTYLLVPEVKLQPATRIEPVVGPRLSSLSLPTDPTDEQVAIVSLSASVGKIKKIETVADGAPNRIIGVNTLYTQV
jgi:hypothetical protein